MLNPKLRIKFTAAQLIAFAAYCIERTTGKVKITDPKMLAEGFVDRLKEKKWSKR